MRNPKIDYAIRKARKDKIYNNIQITSFSIYLNIVAKYLKENYSDLNSDEIQNIVFEDLDKTNRDYSYLGNLRGRYFQLIAAREVVKDKEFIKRTMKKLENTNIDEEDIIFNNDYFKNKENVIKQVWQGYLKVDKKSIRLLEEYVEKSQNIKNKPKKLEKKAKMFIGKPEEIVEEILKYEIPIMEEELKEEVIDLMVFLGEFLDKFGLLDRYITKHNSNMVGTNSFELKCEISTGEYELDKIGLRELFSKEILQKMDVDKLMVLDMFYQNRFSKEIEAIGEAIFAIDALDLWEEAKQKGKITLTDDKIKAIKDKISCLDNISSRLFEEITNHYNLKDGKMEKDFLEIDVSERINRINRHSGEEYREIFDRKLPDSRNDLDRELLVYKTIANIRDNVYAIRENILLTFLYSLIKEKSSKNFGVIKNEYVAGKFINKLSGKYILIGVDHEGLNMPLRLHVNKQNLIDVLKGFLGNSLIQEYEGAEDFVVGSELITTSVLMPISKKQKKGINELHKISKGKKNEKFISHIRFLKEPGMGKFPKHLMQAKNTPKGIRYMMKPKKYVDLQTGEEYILDENGNFVQGGEELDFE